MSASPREVINQFIEQILNQRKLDLLDTLVAADFVEHVPFPGQGPGRDGLRAVLEMFFRAYPDLHWRIEEQIAEGDKIVTRFTFTGRHRGEFLGILPTGKPVSVWGVVIDVVRNGIFTESRIIMDVPSLLRQLGATA